MPAAARGPVAAATNGHDGNGSLVVDPFRGQSHGSFEKMVVVEDDSEENVCDATSRRRARCGMCIWLIAMSVLLVSAVFAQAKQSSGSEKTAAAAAPPPRAPEPTAEPTPAPTPPPPPPMLRFPISFEEEPAGRCPTGWTCHGDSLICALPADSTECNHPGIANVEGSRYLKVGNDLTTGTATSPAFYLPPEAGKIEFRRGGGDPDVGSGLYMLRQKDDKVVCSAEGGADTNSFFEMACTIQQVSAREAVYISVRDVQKGDWGKVLVDNIRLKTASGNDISQAELARPGLTSAPA